MREFLKTKAGVCCTAAFILMLAFMFYRVMQRRHAMAAAVAPAAAAAATTPEAATPEATEPPRWSKEDMARRMRSAVDLPRDDAGETAANLDKYYRYKQQARSDVDRQGNPITRRETSNTPYDAGRETVEESKTPAANEPVSVPRLSIRIQGRPAPSTGLGIPNPLTAIQKVEQIVQSASSSTTPASRTAATVPQKQRPKRFNPYGNIIKCELVFTIDSTNELTPFIGLVMEPVYNNGQLIIPAGAELHGSARPDRLRDRIFSNQEWVLVFPRDAERPNGRQLNVKGVALDRLEPDGNGMTWGITDGSYGLQGLTTRTLQDEEIKTFAATAIAAATQGLQERQTNAFGQDSVKNMPRNAVLEGIAASMQKLSDDIREEINRHGVFIRVPAGHQFYFYPMQIIDPDVADVSSDIATVK